MKCMQANGDDSGPVALLNGSPTDNNATLFKQGYEKAITGAGYTIAADQSVPDWDNTKAGTIFEQMFTKANGKFVGVDCGQRRPRRRGRRRCSSARARPRTSRPPVRTPPTRACSACCSARSA